MKLLLPSSSMAGVYINSIEQLKKEAYRENGDLIDFQVLLAGGLARSSKRISYRPEDKVFLIINEIDESYQEVFESDLKEKTILIEAISKNCLIKTGSD